MYGINEFTLKNTSPSRRVLASTRIKKCGIILSALTLMLSVFFVSPAFSADKKSHFKRSAIERKIPSHVNVNKADAKTLSLVLAGVGKSKADAIVTYRKANGKFTSVEQLAKVKGIGKSIIAENKSKITL